MHPTIQRDIEKAEDKLSWLQSLHRDAVNLRQSINSAEIWHAAPASVKDTAEFVDGAVSELSALIKDAQDELYQAQIATVRSLKHEAAE